MSDTERLAERFAFWESKGKGEWFEALVYAALDDTGSLRKALDLAEQAMEDGREQTS